MAKETEKPDSVNHEKKESEPGWVASLQKAVEKLTETLQSQEEDDSVPIPVPPVPDPTTEPEPTPEPEEVRPPEPEKKPEKKGFLNWLW